MASDADLLPQNYALNIERVSHLLMADWSRFADYDSNIPLRSWSWAGSFTISHLIALLSNNSGPHPLRDSPTALSSDSFHCRAG